VSWDLPGLFNARNAAMAATAVALSLSPSSIDPATTPDRLDFTRQVTLEPLRRFRGVKRRQEVLLDQPELTVIEDFGHHPTALAETLHSFRARFPGALLTAVFEPRSNTARTRTLQAGFSRALAGADEVYLGAVNRSDKLAASERFDTEAVVQQLGAQGVHGFSFETNAALLEALTSAVRTTRQERRRLIVFFTNGSFDGIIHKLVKAVA
jgi:UDP-N-acetylmuramate: L-alanyl-gamma-D-glutamyl-meso-diaminopimelate ligase